ncbi:hypothetical protein EDD16DRAFT_1608191 [Pisolithus croceorrhizus]|nr:hypothetical protein EDD16DRAFT_1608191 [Pisolithus croceorrhizus]KAI6119273.1 hypothetical protein EV401DRAFT_1962590 [Pisolithus croceorrhizus]KAI6165094.1 hypothetical protein EDD17DRAFT_1555731 [Pisolithus thermaeus]
MDFAKFFVALHVHRFTMYPMNQAKICCNANEMVPTSQADEIELIDAVSTVRRPHVLRLHIPTSVQNVKLSFEPNFQGPVTIEIALTMMSSELVSDNNSGPVNPNTSVKAESADTACMIPLRVEHEPSHPGGLIPIPLSLSCDVSLGHKEERVLQTEKSMPTTQGPFVYIPDPLPLVDNGRTDPERDGAPQTITLHAPAIDDSPTEPESLEATPTAIKRTTSDTPVFSLQRQVPGPSLRHTFTPDSFAGSETFDSVNMQLLRERWAQIRERLIVGQENNKRCHKAIFSEASTPTHPSKRFCK